MPSLHWYFTRIVFNKFNAGRYWVVNVLAWYLKDISFRWNIYHLC